MIKSGLILVFIAIGIIGYGQGASLSPYDLKEQYIEKLAFFKKDGTKAISEDEKAELSSLVSLLKENAPNSYEYHFVNGLHLGFVEKAEKELLIAKELKPDQQEVNARLFAYYSCKDERSKAATYANQITRQYSSAQFNYYEQVGADSKATYYVFSGAEDALAAYCLKQQGKFSGEIINLDFLVDEVYRKKIQNKLGMSNTSFLGNEQRFIFEMIQANPTIEFSTTIHQKYLSLVGQRTFLVGLTYAFSGETQIERLENFWTITKTNFDGVSLTKRIEKQLYSNYLPPLLTLYKLKIEQGEKDELLKQSIRSLAEIIGKETEVNGILKRYG